MKNILMFCGLLSVVPQVMACQPLKQAGEPTLICDGQISPEQMESTINIALSGDEDAAMRLLWDALDEGKREEAIYWAQIAMENGSQAGRHGYASLLIQKGDERSLRRARFHLNILIAQGDQDAKVLLEKLPGARE